MLVPPIHFSLVVGKVYRSGHPISLNFSFLETLKLRTIVYLGERGSDESQEYNEWAESCGIRIIRFHVNSVREPFEMTDPAIIVKCLALVSDVRNHPILFHSNKGKHRVGVFVGALRKCLLGWSLTPVYDEYERFAQGKTDADFVFIERFVPYELEVDYEYAPGWMRRFRTLVPNSIAWRNVETNSDEQFESP